MNETALRVDGLSAGYDGKPVVREITFSVESGEILSIIGPNGAGKSTILRAVIRQLEPLAGAVFLRGRDMASMSAGDIARSLSLVLTDRIDGELLTAEDVVLSGRYPYTGRLGLLSPRDHAAAAEAMAQTGVTDLRQRTFRQLSDGQRQRVLLARALCQEPDVLVMDEPTSFLDIRYQWELFALLKELSARRGLAVVLSLHELEFARRISDRILCVRDGLADRLGPPEILTDDSIERLYGLPAGSYGAFYGPHGTTGQAKADVKRENRGQGVPHYSFLQNRQCEMFPCHKGLDPAAFNCLFCYCPLYALGEACGGRFRYTERGIKDCTNCVFPHVREHYGAVLARFPDLAKLAARRK